MYSFNQEPFVSSPSSLGLEAGVYSLVIEDANGCQWETSVELDNPPAISVDAGPNVAIFEGDSTILQAQISPVGNYTISWNPTDSLFCEQCAQTLASPDSTITYQVTVADANGCLATDIVTINVRLNRDVYIPSGFSPNNDQVNDIFMIYAGDGVDRILELEIYSRWGESIFYVANFPPNDPLYGWDGWFRERPAVLDVYVYYAIVLYKDGTEKLFKGDVLLMR